MHAAMSHVTPPPAPDPRQTLLELARARGDSLMALSRLIGRNDAYLQQFVMRGSPRRLAEHDRRRLARHFGVDERQLGAREPWRP